MTDWKAEFIEYFADGSKEADAPVLGVEVEHFIVFDKTEEAVPYSGEKGVRYILTRLMEYYPDAQIIPDDDLLGFSVRDFTITLEPAAQLEISIAPMTSVKRIAGVYEGFRNNLDFILKELGYVALNTACQPVSKVRDLKMIPKRRYDLMDSFFRNVGTGGIEMMRGTASLQVSIDYRNEEDFRRKIQAAYFFGPMFKLFCDNSDRFQGETLRTNLKRTDIWRRVDPSRCGILPDLFSDHYGFSDYADFLGAMPPIFLKHGKDILPTGNKSTAEIFEKRTIEKSDIEHIISMAFPDVRLKKFLEIRFADSVTLPYICAYCALIKGLLYSEEGLAFAARQISELKISEISILKAENELMEKGWDSSVYGFDAKGFAEDIIAIAKRNLPEEERDYLTPFSNKIQKI